MKLSPVSCWLRTAALLALGSLSARAISIPPIEAVQLGKTTFNEQTGAGTVNLISGPGDLPFGFTASVIPKPQNPNDPPIAYPLLTRPTVTLPVGSGALTMIGHDGGNLGFNLTEMAWNYGAPNFTNWGTATKTQLDTLFPYGAYGFSVFGTSIPLNLTAATGLSAPVYTLGGGTWSGGKYVIDVSQTLTVTSSQFAGFSANQNGLIAFQLEGPGGTVSKNSHTYVSNSLISPNFSTDNFFSYTLQPGTLTAGSEYRFYGFFAAQVDSSTALSGSYNVAFEEQSTTFKLLAVPEPSTYAALIGACAVAFAAWRRRRTPGRA